MRAHTQYTPLFSFYLSPSHHSRPTTNTMGLLRLLGFSEGNPATIMVDTASPHSFISEEFLFQNNLNPFLDASGHNHRKASLSVPSMGGYYTSNHFLLLCSVTCESDIVLGADWLSQCRPVFSDNAFGCPSDDSIHRLAGSHGWAGDGK